MAGKWTTIGKGVAVATIGAATSGAIYFMFLGPQFGSAGDFFGIPMAVILPFLVGAGLMAGGYLVKTRNQTLKDILTFGGVALIGGGVFQYANWMTPAVPALRARTPNAALRTPSPIPRPAPAPAATTVTTII